MVWHFRRRVFKPPCTKVSFLGLLPHAGTRLGGPIEVATPSVELNFSSALEILGFFREPRPTNAARPNRHFARTPKRKPSSDMPNIDAVPQCKTAQFVICHL